MMTEDIQPATGQIPMLNLPSHLLPETSEKLARGRRLCARAAGDSDVLGCALLAFHAALEEYMRATLAIHPKVPAGDQSAVLNRYTVQWNQLLALAKTYAGLTATDAHRIRRANRLRNAFAHGGRFVEDHAYVGDYARLVERFIDENILFQSEHPRAVREAYPFILIESDMIVSYVWDEAWIEEQEARGAVAALGYGDPLYVRRYQSNKTNE